jgi:hypothetical protein
MRNLFLLAFIVFVAGCSSSTNPGGSGNNNTVSGPVKISTPDNPGDTIWIRSSDFFQLRIHATIDSIPTNGVSIVYYDPVHHVNQSTQTYNQGDALISLDVQSLAIKRDTTITYVFRGQYNGTITDSIKKVIVAFLGTDSPTPPLEFHSVDESHIEVRWTRSQGDIYDDSVVVSTPVGQQLFIAHNGQSEVTVSGLTIGMVDTISLRTRGGTIAPQQWASVYSTGSKTVRLYDVIGITDFGATVGLTFDSLGIHPVALKSWDSSQVFLYKQSDGFHLLTSYDIVDHQLPPPYPTLTEYSWFSGSLGNSIIDTLFMTYPLSLSSNFVLGSLLNMQTSAYWSTSGIFFIPENGVNTYTYFRIQVNPQPNGTLIGTDAIGSFIEVKVEYQPLPFGFL